MLEQRGHRRVLAAVERPLVSPITTASQPRSRIRELSNQSSGLRAPGPRQLAGLPRVEELRRDHPGPGGQHQRLLQLPHPRRHRILPVLRRHTAVKREPQHPRARFPARPLVSSAHDDSTFPPVPGRSRERPATTTEAVSRCCPAVAHGPQLPHPPAAKHQPPRTHKTPDSPAGRQAPHAPIAAK